MNDTIDTLNTPEKSEPTDKRAGISPNAAVDFPTESSSELSVADVAAETPGTTAGISAPTAEHAPKHPVDTPPKPTSGASTFWVLFWAMVALAAIGLAGWQSYETRERFAEIQREFENRLAQTETEDRASLKQRQEEALTLQNRLAAFETRMSAFENLLAEARERQAALENLSRNLAGKRDGPILFEAEQSVVFAAQQLQLSGNVRGAILALQFVDVRLAEEAQFIGIRKAISRDLDRLRAIPRVDRAGMSMRLENILSAIDSLPLAVDARIETSSNSAEAPEVTGASPVSLEYWKMAGSLVWDKIRGIVRVQRIDRQETVLLAPEQTFFLRENCKLRLLAARGALLSADQRLFRNDVRQALDWIEAYFDTGKASVRATLETLSQLSSVEISAELPSLDESLSAIRNFKAGKESERNGE
ncbi:MAG: uroporphyrinogen-III C-methyltransferase [Candidatus Accumulibacter sp.]|jgi:uroporphyrin-3 C-methyltransferase|nr:uroporphyrinogen-III C-methyltransferase [Accumulibacter sp.]